MSCEDIAAEYTPGTRNGEPFLRYEMAPDEPSALHRSRARSGDDVRGLERTFARRTAAAQRFSLGLGRLAGRRSLATRRSTKNDRGDDYLAKHWYEFRTSGDRRAVVYFDRKARTGRPRWWLYSITE
jgi:hypothetical protein